MISPVTGSDPALTSQFPLKVACNDGFHVNAAMLYWCRYTIYEMSYGRTSHASLWVSWRQGQISNGYYIRGSEMISEPNAFDLKYQHWYIFRPRWFLSRNGASQISRSFGESAFTTLRMTTNTTRCPTYPTNITAEAVWRLKCKCNNPPWFSLISDFLINK